jgi:hypothetical protein
MAGASSSQTPDSRSGIESHSCSRRATVGAPVSEVWSLKNDTVDKPRDAATNRRRGQRGSDPQADQNAQFAGIDPNELVRRGGVQTKRRDREERYAHERQERECSLEEEVGEGERVILVEDGKRERQRGVVAQQLDGPGGIAAVKLAEVERRDCERRERRSPQRAPAHLPTRQPSQRYDGGHERIREDAHTKNGRYLQPLRGVVKVQRCRERTDPIRDPRDPLRSWPHAQPFAPQNRMHHD